MRNLTVLLLAVSLAAAASADVLDRPTGIKVGQRMTLRPYVSLSVTYDSNVGGTQSSAGKKGDVLWTVNPGLGIDYKAENWALLLNLYYQYHSYTKRDNVDKHSQHSYGETLRWNWSDSRGAEKGWSLMIGQSFQQITMTDDISMGDGAAYTANRKQFSFNAALQRRFNEHWHGDINGSYYLLDYDNDTGIPSRTALYGWQRWTAGVEAGYAPSRWTDILASLGYQGYLQDNVNNAETGIGQGLSRESQGYTAMAGIGSYMTERISYRLLAGWSRFEYANAASSSDGFVYSISGNWKISDTLQTMLLATSYYQPSEREYASKSRVDSVSWGIGKSLVRGKLRATLDATYRHETHEHIRSNSSDYSLDVATARLGFNYTLNRFLSGFVYGEYQRSFNNERQSMSSYGDYDRWRATMGLRLTY